MTGRSVALDPRTNAVRRDLADIRLADRVFAPHYALAMPRRVMVAATLRDGPDVTAEAIAKLDVGDAFEVLELAGDHAWGVAVAMALVGYVDAGVLGLGEGSAA